MEIRAICQLVQEQGTWRALNKLLELMGASAMATLKMGQDLNQILRAQGTYQAIDAFRIKVEGIYTEAQNG